MTPTENKKVVEQFFEASSRGDVEGSLAFWAPDAVNHGRFLEGDPRDRRMPTGLDGLRRVLSSLHTAFPDRQWQIKDIVAEGDKVMCRVWVSGTHRGVPEVPVEGGPLLQAISPTGKSYSVQHIHEFRLANGKIAEHWAARDDLALLEDLGGINLSSRKTE